MIDPNIRAHEPMRARQTMTAAASNTGGNQDESTRIPDRVGTRGGSLPYQPVASATYREDELLAVEWRCKIKTAHQRKLRAADDAALVIRTRRTHGHYESAAAYARPIEDAMAAAPVADPLHAECLTDAEEDVLQECYRANPCEVTARALLRKRAANRAASLDHDREIAARHGIML